MGTESDPGFLVEGPGAGSLSGVFEDDGETGYLYIYDRESSAVMQDLHIYDRTPALLPRGRVA